MVLVELFLYYFQYMGLSITIMPNYFLWLSD